MEGYGAFWFFYFGIYTIYLLLGVIDLVRGSKKRGQKTQCLT